MRHLFKKTNRLKIRLFKIAFVLISLVFIFSLYAEKRPEVRAFADRLNIFPGKFEITGSEDRFIWKKVENAFLQDLPPNAGSDKFNSENSAYINFINGSDAPLVSTSEPFVSGENGVEGASGENEPGTGGQTASPTPESVNEEPSDDPAENETPPAEKAADASDSPASEPAENAENSETGAEIIEPIDEAEKSVEIIETENSEDSGSASVQETESPVQDSGDQSSEPPVAAPESQAGSETSFLPGVRSIVKNWLQSIFQTTPANADEQTGEESAFVAGETRQGIVFSDFSLPFAGGESEIGQVNLRLSLTGQTEMPGDRILVELKKTDNWEELGSLEFDQINQDRDDYFSFPLPKLESWEEIGNLSVRVSYFNPADQAGRMENVSVLLDAIWLEAEYAASQDEAEESEEEVVLDDKKETEEPDASDAFELLNLFEKDHFRYQDDLKFVYKYQRKNRPLMKRIKSSITGLFGDEYGNLKIRAKILDAVKVESQDFRPEVVYLSDGEFEIKRNDAGRQFKPGKYTLEIEIEDDGEIYTQTKDFTWGVLAFNTDKSIYLPGEKAYLQFGVLDDKGHTICNADLDLDLFGPDGTVVRLSTSDGTIARSGECGPDNVIDIPDYYAHFETSLPGTYSARLVANTRNGERELTDYFQVQSGLLFEIRRTGPTRIYPSAPYKMIFQVKAKEDYAGEFREFVPADFDIIGDGFEVHENGDTKEIVWQADWTAGKTYEFHYIFDAPDVSPEFYLAGPARTGEFEESRAWQIASDAVIEHYIARAEAEQIDSSVTNNRWSITGTADAGTAASANGWIAGSNFTVGQRYLIMVWGNHNSGNANQQSGLRVTHGGTEFAESQTLEETDQINAAYKTPYFWFTVWTAANEDIDVWGYRTGNTSRAEDVTLIAINAENLLSEGSLFYNIHSVADSLLTTTWTPKANISFNTKNAGDDWWIGAYSRARIISTNAANYESRLNIDSGTIVAAASIEGEDNTDTPVYGLGWVQNFSRATHTVAVQVRETAANQGYENSGVFALRLNRFVDFATSTNAGSITLQNAGTYYEAGAADVMPTTESNWLVAGGFIADDNNGIVTGRIQESGANITAERGGWQHNAADTFQPFTVADISSFSTAAKNIDFDARRNGGSVSYAIDPWLAAFSLDLKSNPYVIAEGQYDGTSLIANGDWTSTTSVRLKAIGNTFSSASELEFYFQLIPIGSNFTVATSEPSSACAAGVSYSSCFGKIWKATSSPDGLVASTTATIHSIPESSEGYKWQVMVYDPDDNTSGWRQFNQVQPNFMIDTAAPTAPGQLTELMTTGNSAVLNLGSSTVESNFYRYRVFYLATTTGNVTESDTELVDSNLDYQDYNSAGTISVSGLSPNTAYKFNIWAYDLAGKKSSSTQTAITTKDELSVSAYRQYKSDNFTLIPNQGWTNESEVYVSGLASNLGTSTSGFDFYFEMIDESGSFTTSTSTPASPCPTGTAYGSCAGKIWTANVAATPWYDNDWKYRKTITVNANKVATTAAAFVLLATTTDSSLAHENNGGHMALATGYDLIAVDDDNLTLLEFEREYYSSSTGEIALWVKTDISSTTNKTFYLYYGNSASADHSVPANVWGADYRAVLHMNNAPTGANTVRDSTQYNEHGSVNGTYMNAGNLVSGQIGHAVYFRGSWGDREYMWLTDSGADNLDSLTGAGQRRTYSYWASLEFNHGQFGTIVTDKTNGFTGTHLWSETHDSPNIIRGNVASGNDVTSPTLSANKWYYHVFSYNGATMNYYVDGQLVDSRAVAAPGDDNNNLMVMGNGGNNDYYSYGTMDELRLRNIAQSAADIETEYNNQSDVSSFMSFSQEESVDALSYEGKARITSLPDRGLYSNSEGYKWQVMMCTDASTCTAWDDFNPAMPNFRVDTTFPTAPGNLTLSTTTPTSLELFFGSSTVEANFNTYKIFYKSGISGAKETDTLHADSNLGYIDYNSAIYTTISNLRAGTQYVINIWAYDLAGNKANATELIRSTDEASHARANTIVLQGGIYSGNGSTGQDSNTNHSFTAFNFNLPEYEADIRSAYVIFESQFESYHSNSGNYTGYSLAFDACQEPCTADAFGAAEKIQAYDNTVLAYDESGGNQIKLLFDVTDEMQMAAYAGNGREMEARIGYNLETGSATTSIANAKAFLVITYSYNDDDSSHYVNTVYYPLESTISGDKGSRRAVLSGNCTKNSTCPTFNYKMMISDFSAQLSQWFQIYGINDSHGSNDLTVSANIQGSDIDSDYYIHEAANGGEQGSLPTMVFKNIPGFTENPTATQTLEIYPFSTGADIYALGGEVAETYRAAKSESVKTRTVSFPIGAISAGQSVLTASGTASVYFPENGAGSGVVDIKKAWFRITGNNYYDGGTSLTVSTKVGNNSQSANSVYNMNQAANVVMPVYRLVHVISETEYAELEAANANTAKDVQLFTTNSSAEMGGVSAELVITYTYTDESNGYLSNLKLFAGQSNTAANSTGYSSEIARSVFPELRGDMILRAAAMRSAYLASDSDGDAPGTWFALGSNIGTTSPNCENLFGSKTDGLNSYFEFYNSVDFSILPAVDAQTYYSCITNSNSSDESAGAKMNSELIYTYQWNAPPSEFTQYSWRWYENNDDIQPTTPKAEEKTAATGVNLADTVRLRISVGVTNKYLATSTQTFKLQYGTGSDCSAVSDWGDVGGFADTTVWRAYNNPTPSDGTVLSSGLLSTTTAPQSYEEENISLANPASIEVGGFGEWDWVLYNNNATSSADYCFRMVRSNGSLFDDYLSDSFPKLTTAPANTMPAGPSLLEQYKSAGTTTIANLGWTNESTVRLSAGVTDPNINENLSLYFELIPSANSFTTATTVPVGACLSGTAYGSCGNKIWIATSTSGDYRINPFNATTTVTGIPDSSAGYKWQVLACDDSGACSNLWASFGSAPNFRVDTVAPTAPGSLIDYSISPTTVTLSFGASTTELNFNRYRVYYKVGSGGVTEADFEHSDSNLGYIDYNNATSTKVINLSAGTQYTFNIWAYDYVGNKASSTVVSTTTLSSYTPPAGNIVTVAQKTDGSGAVDIAIRASDPDNDNTLRAKVLYKAGLGCDFTSGYSVAYIDPTDENTSATKGADPKVDNGSAYQVGTTTGYIWTSLGLNFVFFDWLSRTNLPDVSDSYCIGVVVNDGMFDQAATSTQSIYIDNRDPAAFGGLTLNKKGFDSVTLDFGTSSSDTNFDAYRIYYKQGFSGVTESDTAFTKANDPNLDHANYGGAATTTITGLNPNTDYVFKIWAYDLYGNKASTTEIHVKTNAKPINISADGQYLDDGITPIANGDIIGDNDVVLKASVHDQDVGDLLTFYYQLIPATNTYSSLIVPPSGTCSSGTDYDTCTSKIWSISTTSSALPSDWYDSNWLYRKRITVNASQVVSNESGFPVLATTTDSQLAAKARSDGFDILFTSSDGKTVVPYERELFSSSTGQLAVWIKTDISSTTDTDLYMYYGNSGAITDHATTTGVWDNNSRGVWHLTEDVVDESSQANVHFDSTVYSNYGSQFGNNEYLAKIYRGQRFDGIDDYIEIADSASLDLTSAVTISMWINGSVTNPPAEQKVPYSSAGNSTFIVPAGVTSITVKAWGGGAGGGSGSWGNNTQQQNKGGNGGGGGFVQSTISVTPGETINVTVGGGGGGGSYIADGGSGGGGGGCSQVLRSTTPLAVAPGGGAGGGANNRNYSAGAPGGPGGGVSGSSGDDSGTATGGTGGTQSSGGTGGAGTNSGTNGGSLVGGEGADGRNAQGADGGANNGGAGGGADGGLGSVSNSYAGAGGGGCGYYGGGGGGEVGIDGSAGAGGGGGSAYLTGSATSTVSGSGVNAGNNTDSDYAGAAGAAGAGGDAGVAGSGGNDGLVIISYTPAIVLAGKGDNYQINLNNSSYLTGAVGTSTASSQIGTGWQHIALTYDQSAGGTDELKLYVNGDIVSSADYSQAIAADSSPLQAGLDFNGIIDELSVSGVARSPGWIKSAYRNQDNVSTFLNWSGESTVTSYYETVLTIDLPDSGTGYKWQVMACDDDSDCSGWDNFNATVPNFKVDTMPPTPPGQLTEHSKTSSAITLSFGDPTVEANFTEYKIFYSTSPAVTESDSEHIDANLSEIDFNDAEITTVYNLNPNTPYYFNIWAYDAVGNKASSTVTAITTSGAMSSPGAMFYTKGTRVLYYRVWDGDSWLAEQSGPTLGSGAGDNIRHIRTIRSDDGGKVGILVKTWDGTNQEWWGAVYRFAADDFVATSSLGSSLASSDNSQLITGCIAPLSGGEFMVVRNNNASAGTQVFSWSLADGWTAEAAGPNPGAVLNGCSLTRRPGSDNYILMTFDDDSDVGAAYYYGGSTYANSWTAWTEHSGDENDTDNYTGSAFFDPADNTRGAISFAGSAAASYTQAKYFVCSNNSINFGNSASTPAGWSGNFVHGEFAADPGGTGVAYFAGRDTNNELNVYQVNVSSGATPVWSTPTNGDDISSGSLYDEINDSQKPFAIDFYRSGKGLVTFDYSVAILPPQYSVITTAGNTLDASVSSVPGAGANLWTRVRTYKDPSENELLAIYQNDDVDYAAVFWDGGENRFYNSADNPGSSQVWTDIAGDIAGVIDRDDENFSFSFTGYNSAPISPTSLIQQKSDGATVIANGGWTNESQLKLKLSAKDPDTEEVLATYIQFIANADTFATTTDGLGSACASTTAFSACSSKIWHVATSSAGDYSINAFTPTLALGSVPDSANGYKWQAVVCDDDNACSAWQKYNVSVPNVKVDTVAPTAPGAMTIGSKTSYSVTLNYGATTTESNFKEYRIFYATSTSPVTWLYTEHDDSDLDFINYNNTSNTIVLNLASSTLYYFNIWAVDWAGNIATSSAEVSTTTSAAASTTQASYILENDDTSDVNTNTAEAAPDTQLSNLYIGERLIARIQIENGGGDTASNKVYKLQYENQTDAPGVWLDVGSATQTSYALGLSGTTGSLLTSAKASMNGKTWQNGYWYENTNLTGSYTLPNGRYTEFAFAIKTNNALAGKTYRLRLFNNTDNRPLDNYSQYPTFTTVASSLRAYSKDAAASLGTGTTSLAYYLDPEGYADVSADDGNSDTVTSSGNIPAYHFIAASSTNTDSITITWNGQSSVSAATRGIYLQVYRFGTTNAWVTVATNTSAAADTDFTLSYYLNSYLSEHYDPAKRTFWRVYQATGNQTLRTDYFNASFAAPTANVSQNHYRWRNDNGSEIAATWREAEDTGDPTAGTNLIIGANVRLRFAVGNAGAGTSTNATYRIEYAPTVLGCASDPGGWTAIPATPASGEHFQVSTSTYFADGANTTATTSNPEGYTFVAGRIVEHPSNITAAITLSERKYTELEYNFLANSNSINAGTYCFRVTNNGTSLNSYTRYAELTMAGNTNIAPSFTANPSDGGSATNTPTNYGTNVQFSATAQDADGDDYYLAICKSSGITAGNNAAPICTGGNWCISAAASSTNPISCSHNATSTSESLNWFAYVCDKKPGVSIAKCSAVSQGGSGTANDSPFVINHPPAYIAVNTTDNFKDPGGTFTITASSTETDTLGSQDSQYLYVCKTNDATFAGCTGGPSDTLCSATAVATPNPSCNFTDIAPTPAGNYTYYAFIYDNHGLAATTSPRSNIYTVNNSAPVLGAQILNGGAPITLNLRGAADKTVSTANTSVVDLNGCSSLVSATAVIYMSNATGGHNCSANNNDCYQINVANCVKSDCDGPDDITATYTCNANLKYFAIPTDNSSNNPYTSYNWLSRLLVNDGANLVASTSAGVELNTNQALAIQEDEINFGTNFSPGQNTGTTTQPSTVLNAGNCPINTDISGTDMSGNPSGSITVDNLKYDLVANFNYLMQGEVLTYSDTSVDTDIPRPTGSDASDVIYWGIGIPYGTDSSIFSGQNNFTVVLDNSNWN